MKYTGWKSWQPTRAEKKSMLLLTIQATVATAFRFRSWSSLA
jgi:hypothetical protein